VFLLLAHCPKDGNRRCLGKLYICNNYHSLTLTLHPFTPHHDHPSPLFQPHIGLLVLWLFSQPLDRYSPPTPLSHFLLILLIFFLFFYDFLKGAMGVLAPSAVRVPIRKCEVKNGKKKTQGNYANPESDFVCEENRMYCFFCVSRFGAYLRFYCYQYRDHSASGSR
jgi:hypothetical protein